MLSVDAWQGVQGWNTCFPVSKARSRMYALSSYHLKRSRMTCCLPTTCLRMGKSKESAGCSRVLLVDSHLPAVEATAPAADDGRVGRAVGPEAGALLDKAAPVFAPAGTAALGAGLLRRPAKVAAATAAGCDRSTTTTSTAFLLPFGRPEPRFLIASPPMRCRTPASVSLGRQGTSIPQGRGYNAPNAGPGAAPGRCGKCTRIRNDRVSTTD